VLVAAGNPGRIFGQEKEAILMLRSINGVKLAELLAFDVSLFKGIPSDPVLGVELPEPDDAKGMDEIMMRLEVERCGAYPYFIEQVILFCERHDVRQVVTRVGMSLSEKTRGLNTPQKSLIDSVQRARGMRGALGPAEPKADPDERPIRLRRRGDGAVAILVMRLLPDHNG